MVEIAKQWIELLYKLKCVHENRISNPPGYNLALDFVESLSQHNYSGLKGGESVTLTIEGVFLKIEAGTSQVYIGMDQLLNVTLTPLTS